VAIAVSAFSGTTLEQAGVLRIEDLTAMTPGFAISSYNPATPAPYIRGVGTNSSSVGDDASVGVFVDDVYAGRAGSFRTDLFDVERVEVLRGPQGTLYGRNVAGGAIRIATRGPTGQKEGYVETEYGDYDLLAVRAALGGALDAGLSGRLALAGRQRDGHTDNVLTGSALRDEDNLSLRAKLAAELGDDASLLLTADYAEDDLRGPATRSIVDENGPPNGVTDEVTLLRDGFMQRDIGGLSLRFDVELGIGDLTAIAALRRNEYRFLDDLTGAYVLPALGTPLPLLNDAREESTQYSQEFRLTGSRDALEYTLGLYLFEEEVERVESFDSSAIVGVPGFSRAVWDSAMDSSSYAAFGEITWHADEAWSLVAGGRYTRDDKDFANRATTPDLLGFLLEPYEVEASRSWSEFTPRLTLQYRARDALMLYASGSAGFKSGGFNALAATAAEARAPFAPERARNFEIGIKADLPERKLRVNAAAFLMDYSDLQNFFLQDGIVVTATADAEMRGFELELWATPAEGLDLSFSYAYLDSEYTDFPSDPDNEGNRLMRAPEHSLSAALGYRWRISDALEGLLRLDYSHQDRIFFDAANAPVGAAPSYALLGARAALSHSSGWELSLWGRNLADEAYVVHAFELLGSGFAVYGDPRLVGLGAAYRF
jgi:iron complex outermembrane receptor protein